MTEDEVLALGAGREMDEVVATYVMEKPKPVVQPTNNPQFLDSTYDLWGGAWTVRFEGGSDVGTYEPRSFSEKIEVAWELLEQMVRDGTFISIGHGGKHWSVKFCTRGMWERGEYGSVEAPTAPLAVCRAALLAVAI